MPWPDFAVSLQTHLRVANVLHAIVFEIFCQIATDVRRAIIT